MTGSRVRRRNARRGGHARAAVITVVLLAVGAAAVFGGRRLYARMQHEKEVAALLDTNLFYRGITVQGVNVGGMTLQQAKNALKGKEKEAAGHYDIAVTYGGKTWRLTEADMTFSGNTDEVLKAAYSYGRTGDREQRWQRVKALEKKPKNYTLSAKPDEDALKKKTGEIAAQVNREPEDPTVVSFNPAGKTFVYRDGVQGLEVDTQALWAGVKAVAEGPRTGTVALKVNAVPFETSLAQVKSHMRKIGEYSTTSTNSADGTYNMMRALKAVSGTVVKPGATFSFFGRVGPCDQAHGYRPAGAILNGSLVQDYGGGICQASTTLYGAILRAGMEVVERTNHSIPSSYCPIGQDATVSYPALDLKFRNPTPYPVYILTYTSGRRLTAEVYGYRPPEYDEIRVTSQVTQTIAAPSKPRYVQDRSLPAGSVRLAAKAHTGYRAAAQRVYYKNGKIVKTEKLPSSYYKPQAACYLTGAAKTSSASSSSRKPASSKPASQKPESGSGAAA